MLRGCAHGGNILEYLAARAQPGEKWVGIGLPFGPGAAGEFRQMIERVANRSKAESTWFVATRARISNDPVEARCDGAADRACVCAPLIGIAHEFGVNHGAEGRRRRSGSVGATTLGTFMMFAILLACPALAAHHAVLVVFSDNRLLPVDVEVDEALRGTLAQSTDVDVYTEFLDRSRFSGAAYEAAMVDLLRTKYANPAPEAVVAGGLYATQFLIANRSRIFRRHTPIVFVGLSTREVAALSPLPPDVIGIPVQFDYEGTIEQALRMHPNSKKLVLVTGASDLDRANEEFLRSIEGRYKEQVQIVWFAALPLGVLVKRLRALEPNTVVFTPGFFRDGSDRYFTPRESARIVAEASVAPVYGPYSTFIGTGIVGGRMPSWRTMGMDAAGLVAQLFDGIEPAAVQRPRTTAPRSRSIGDRHAVGASPSSCLQMRSCISRIRHSGKPMAASHCWRASSFCCRQC